MNQNSMERFQQFLGSRRRWLGVFMLLLLHVSLLPGWGSVLQRALLISHLGMFLLWQPIWRGEKKLSSGNILLVGGVSLLFVLWINWWLITLWIVLLVSLIGGLVFASQERLPRWFYLAAELYLVGALLVWVVPHLLPGGEVTFASRFVLQFGLPLIIAVMALMPSREPLHQLQTIDFFYSLLLFLLMAALVLGSFVLKVEAHEDYPIALMSALLIIATVLFALSWFWNPRGGFAGLEQIFSRYLLSIGLPFEQWLYQLAKLSESEDDPESFLKLGMDELARVPGVLGGDWQSPDGHGNFGQRGVNMARFSSPPIALDLYAKAPFSPAMLLHFNLLVQLVSVFYQSKRRQQILEQQAYLQAIHETGSRLTHDVKNLLQSLKALCSAAELGRQEDGCSLQSLFARQLPRITLRLEQTLEKLRQPVEDDQDTLVDASVWWAGLQQRYSVDLVDFKGLECSAEVLLPAELFDNVADNLLQNALEKRKLDNGLNIIVSLRVCGGLSLRVCDDGALVPDELANKLFVAPLPSRNGLGVGLYQASRMATRRGYQLRLAINETEQVCFELLKASVT